jgi:hypothetical protein
MARATRSAAIVAPPRPSSRRIPNSSPPRRRSRSRQGLASLVGSDEQGVELLHQPELVNGIRAEVLERAAGGAEGQDADRRNGDEGGIIAATARSRRRASEPLDSPMFTRIPSVAGRSRRARPLPLRPRLATGVPLSSSCVVRSGPYARGLPGAIGGTTPNRWVLVLGLILGVSRQRKTVASMGNSSSRNV